MARTLKGFVRSATRYFGYEISRYSPISLASVQLAEVLKLANINVVLDVGANEGQFAREIREHGYFGKIVSFEPLSDAHIKLLGFASRDQAWHVHGQLAIGDSDGEVEIHVAGNSVSSSVLPMLETHSNAAMGSAYVASERVPIARLDSVIDQYVEADSNLFVKIDTQGFEWQVLNGAPLTIQRALGVLCELSLVPLYDGQALWRDIIDRLEAEGFVLWALQKGFTDPRSGQSLQMDGIFLRSSFISSAS